MRLLLKNGTIVNEGSCFKGSLLIEDEFIKEIIPESSFREFSNYLSYIAKLEQTAEVIDVTGLHILPGVIDCHVHFRQPGDGKKGTIESESRAVVLGGVTSFMDMPNTLPPTTTKELLKEKFNIAKDSSYANYSFYLGASKDNIEEIKSLDKRNVCGVKLFMGAS
ncbi:MAG: amidohydrolase family protein, partial [Bacteroidales bacterium]|nr:amidohydrolase family protein [Bacteroidales bacterium]